MAFNLLIFISYYVLILTSILGYGLFFLKLFNIKIEFNNFGYVGLFGLYILLIYSYFSNIIFAHGELHNSIVILLGIFLFIFFIKTKYPQYKQEIIFTTVVFAIIFCSLLQFKNHDDFPYYHFPYTHYLTQQSLYIGIGKFNHGFKTPSSIFYINSLFYLPLAKYHLYNFSSIFILGFANIILLKKIHNFFEFSNSQKRNKIDFINFLSLASFMFINIFFYRLSEYGTDRAAMILIFIFIIELLRLVNLKNIKTSDLFYIYLLGGIIISLKAFYILYIIFVIPLFIFIYAKKNFSGTLNFLFLNKFFGLFLVILFFVLGTYFINTGCILYPISLTCFDSLNWGISSSRVQALNDWYHLWSKGGAGPNFRVANPDEYIEGFNWVSNWIDVYFFNKVSDYILGVIVLLSIFIFTFRKNFFSKKLIKINFSMYLIYFIILILLVEWFYNHPALRYGGYHILALLLFIPISIKISSSKINLKKYLRNVIILITLTISIFISRNINRIDKEIKFYNYKPFKETFYSVDYQYFRIQERMDKLLKAHNKCQEIDNECNSDIKIKKKYGIMIFIN